MAGFYIPKHINIMDKPLIVYPCLGLEKVLERKVGSIKSYLEKLYISNSSILNVGTYHILIMWDEASDDKSAISRDTMCDIWIFDKLDSWGSGPLVDVKIFRNYILETGIGVSAGDGLLMLGREEELRRNSKSLSDYLNGKRANLPQDISAKEEFEK